jgi:hypothetical protein
MDEIQKNVYRKAVEYTQFEMHEREEPDQRNKPPQVPNVCALLLPFNSSPNKQIKALSPHIF